MQPPSFLQNLLSTYVLARVTTDIISGRLLPIGLHHRTEDVRHLDHHTAFQERDIA